MRRIGSDDGRAADEVAAVLKSGGVAVLPTDTLYGFSASITSRSGYDSILRLKAAATSRNFVHLADSVDMVERYVAGWGSTTKSAMENIWPASLSAIFTASDTCPEWIGATVAFRVPQHALLTRIIAKVGEPVVSTSVNRPGAAPLNEAGDIEREFGSSADLIVVADVAPGGAPSTLVDFSGRHPVVRRNGSYTWLD